MVVILLCTWKDLVVRVSFVFICTWGIEFASSSRLLLHFVGSISVRPVVYGRHKFALSLLEECTDAIMIPFSTFWWKYISRIKLADAQSSSEIADHLTLSRYQFQIRGQSLNIVLESPRIS